MLLLSAIAVIFTFFVKLPVAVEIRYKNGKE